MSLLPTFGTFSFNENGFITEKIEFRQFAQRATIRAKIARREGIKVLSTEFGEKQITIIGFVTASSPAQLQSMLDDLKNLIQAEEGSLVVENGRTYRATVTNLVIPDEHYNQSKANFEVSFVTSDPFASGALLTVIQNVPSGTTTFSGYVSISGTFFVRPTIIYRPPDGDGSGRTGISKLVLVHEPTGQELTVSGFGNGVSLVYGVDISLNFDNFTSLEGATVKNNSGSFARWNTGDNNYFVQFTGPTVGGTIELSYQPRYL